MFLLDLTNPGGIMTTFTKLAQMKLEEKFEQTRNTKLVQSLEKKLPFEVKEETLKEIAKNVIERAKMIREGLKTDPMGTVKKYKSLLDVHTLAPATKKKKPTAKKKVTTPKKALKKATVAKSKTAKAKKSVH
jgi:hypothetical protein